MMESIISIVGITVLALVGFYVLLCIALYFLQSKMMYVPSFGLEATPADMGLDFEPIALHTEDLVKLSAWFVPADNAKGTILFSHGNGGNISGCLDTIRVFHRLGWSTLAYDYRGYGESAGRPSEQGTYEDARTALRFLTESKKIERKNIVLFGRSLGGAVAANLAMTHPPAALIIESTISSVPELAAGIYPLLPVRLLTRYRYNTREYLRDVHCPILVIHSTDDEIVPYHHGREIFNAANEPKEFFDLTGGHNEGFLISGQEYEETIGRFLKKVTES